MLQNEGLRLNARAASAQWAPENSCALNNAPLPIRFPACKHAALLLQNFHAARSSLLALQQVADLREQSLLLGQCGRLRRLGLHDLIYQLDHEEQNPSDDDEVDDDGEETPPRQDRALFLGFDQRIRSHLR